MYRHSYLMHNHFTFVKPKPKGMLHYENLLNRFRENTKQCFESCVENTCKAKHTSLFKHHTASLSHCIFFHWKNTSLSHSIFFPYTWCNSNIAQTTLGHYQQDFEINCSREATSSVFQLLFQPTTLWSKTNKKPPAHMKTGLIKY